MNLLRNLGEWLAETAGALAARFDAAPALPESWEGADADRGQRERVARALLTAILGTDDGDLVSGDFEIHASEIARLIVEEAADAALAAARPDDDRTTT